ncbi:hypothetical protein [Brevibacterium salitolerans]|uniref:Uncharacterized protein n=1 Tax=Brevibacterium salitolerans TaxID=1403566 RepID=A0ABN2WIA1_9MICO
MTFDPAGVRTIYDSAVRNGYGQGWRDGWTDGYLAGRRAQSLQDDELVQALAEAQRTRELLMQDVSASIKATIAGLEARKARRNQYSNFDARKGVRAA